MIQQIQLKEYLQIKRLRRLRVAPRAIVLKMPDGKYYKNNRIDIKGVQELWEMRHKQKAEIEKQQSLL